jgi:hypothetical protein
LFLLAFLTGGAFWVLDGLMKGYQFRYYVRMREIEYTAYLLNRVILGGKYRRNPISAPRIDMTWDFTGYPVDKTTGKPQPPPRPRWRRRRKRDKGAAMPEDWRADEPWRREPQEIYNWLRHRWWRPNVMLPHVLAVGLGGLLFIIFAALNASGFDHLHP